MAHFLASIQGCRGEASRLGSKESGITARIGSWEGGVEVHLYYDASKKLDMARISMIQWQGRGIQHLLYDGPASGGHFKALQRLTGKK